MPMPNREQLGRIEAIAVQLTELRAETLSNLEHARRMSPLYETNQLLAAILLELREFTASRGKEE